MVLFKVNLTGEFFQGTKGKTGGRALFSPTVCATEGKSQGKLRGKWRALFSPGLQCVRR